MSIVLAQRLVVVSHVEGKGHFFANTAEDNGPSILCLSRRARVPQHLADGDGLSVTGPEYYTFDLPPVDTKIVALVAPGSTDDKRFAVAWTPQSLWHAASLSYVVTYHSPAGSQEVWSGSGILELSYTFPTNTWEPGGVFWRSSDGLSSLQVVARSVQDGTLSPKGPKRDPRVPLDKLERTGCDRRHELLLK